MIVFEQGFFFAKTFLHFLTVITLDLNFGFINKVLENIKRHQMAINMNVFNQIEPSYDQKSAKCFFIYMPLKKSEKKSYTLQKISH